MIRYLEETDLKDLAGDALVLLINVFDDRTVKEASDAFVEKLIHSLTFIVDEGTLLAVISILICILPYMEKNQAHNNIILKEFIRPDREDFYKGQIMQLTNQGSAYRMDKCMQSIAVIMQNSDSEHFFNVNDIDLIVDIGIRALGDQNTSKTRVQVLRTLKKILDH